MISLGELTDRVYLEIGAMLYSPIRRPSELSNDDFRACLGLLNRMRLQIAEIERAANADRINPNSFLFPIAELRKRMNVSIRVQYEAAEAAFAAGVDLPADAFRASKESTARWIAASLSTWTGLRRKIDHALALVPDSRRAEVNAANANIDINQLGLDFAPVDDDDEIDWPEQPDDVDDGSWEWLSDLRDWYFGLDPRPGLDFERIAEGGFGITLTFDWCDDDGGGS